MVLYLIPIALRVLTTPVDMIADVIESFLGSPELNKVERKGDKIVKHYVIRRLKVKPEKIDELVFKIREAIEPPLRNPGDIKVEIKPLEQGTLTEDVEVIVELPVKGAVARTAEKVKEKVLRSKR